MDNETYKGYNIEVTSDMELEPWDPREWDNLGTMVCFHRNYSLGDKHDINTDEFSSLKEIAEHLIKVKGACVILPLYLMDHSGISMSTGSFHCPWDSGQVGFIYATKEDIRKNFMIKNVTKEKKEHTERILQGEVKTYDAYISGQVYGYNITDADGEEVERDHGYAYGYEWIKEMVDECKAIIDNDIIFKRKKSNDKLKVLIKNNVPLLCR